jgi:hypothetical protein
MKSLLVEVPGGGCAAACHAAPADDDGSRAARQNLAMADDYVIPEPEPKEIDEKLAIELRHLADNAVLKGKPQGDERCDNCRYYLENTAEISYCWHQKLRILVGADWWCQWWEAIPDDA